MTNKSFRKLLSSVLKGFNAYYGDNTGSFGELDYKINYQVVNNTLKEGERIYVLDIDVWCKSTSRVDIIADEIEALLDYKTKSIEQGSFATFYLDNRYNADEKEIYRRTLTYSVKTYMED